MTYRTLFPSVLLAVGFLLCLSGCSDDPTAPELTDPRLFLTASAGDHHTCGITVDGTLLCWGFNLFGQVGDGTNLNRQIPTQIGGTLRFNTVSAGGSHTCALTQDGTAYCWGTNTSGQLGLGSVEDDRTVPTSVNTELRFTAIAAGQSHSCAIDTEGYAYCWGNGMLGEVGGELTDDCGYSCAPSPVKVETDLRFKQLSSGRQHTCGVARNGGLYCWGSNEYGRLGAATTELCENYGVDFKPCSPIPIPISAGGSWTEVSAGGTHTCGITGNGTGHCWGLGISGLLGDGTDLGVSGYRTDAQMVASESKFANVSAGRNHTCAASRGSQILCWGTGDLGDGSGQDSPIPVPVASTVRFTMAAVGTKHSCGVSSEGIMYCWGSNQYGQLGDGSNSFGWPTPVAVRGW